MWRACQVCHDLCFSHLATKNRWEAAPEAAQKNRPQNGPGDGRHLCNDYGVACQLGCQMLSISNEV